MDTEKILQRIETLKLQRENLVNQANAELQKVQNEIRQAQKYATEIQAKGNQEAANLTGRIEELEELLKLQL